MSETPPWHLVFSCGSSWYAVPAQWVAEVVTFPGLTQVPGGSRHLLGVFAHRGEVIPVVDLGLLTGSTAEASRRAVVLRLPGGALGLTASHVAGVAELTGKMDPLGPTGVKQYLRGPARSPTHEVAVIEPEGLFDFLSQAS